MEYLDLYDKNQQLTGEIIAREKLKQELPENRFVKIVLIFIQNSEDKFLIQFTSEEKGFEIATTGGHVQAGQTSKEAIINEVKEELGPDITHEDFQLVGTNLFKQVFFDVYYLKKDLVIEDLKLQKEEVDHVEWLTLSDIRELININKLRKSNIPALDLVLDYLNKKIKLVKK